MSTRSDSASSMIFLAIVFVFLFSDALRNHRRAKQPQVMELTIEDTVVGVGLIAERGRIVTVHYIGTLMNGSVFDSTNKVGGSSLRFVLGDGHVIIGLEQGIIGMKVGGHRRLIIPPKLGYGSEDLGLIPPNSTLIYEIELLEIG